jgi:hypothetical protein
MACPPSRSSGLSRLEASVALVIIGVLISIALPRLAAPRVAAQQVRLKTLMATAQTAAALFHGRCLLERSRLNDEPCSSLLVEGSKVAGVNYWPSATAQGIVAALNRWTDTPDMDWLPDRVDGVPALRARLKPAAAAGTCEFLYVQAASPGAAPRIVLVDASCP